MNNDLTQTECYHSSHLIKIESIKDELSETVDVKLAREELFKDKVYSPTKIRKLLLERKMPKENLWRNTLVKGIPEEW